jgi:hypothetical protein
MIAISRQTNRAFCVLSFFDLTDGHAHPSNCGFFDFSHALVLPLTYRLNYLLKLLQQEMSAEN